MAEQLKHHDLQGQCISPGSKHARVEISEYPLEISGDRLLNHAALDWPSPTDSRNPENWSGPHKAYTLMSVSLVCLAISLGTSIVTPAIRELEDRFGVSRELALVSLSVFVYGLALGPCIAAPISETFGRMRLIKGSVVIYVLFLVGAATAPSFGGFLACRFLAAVAGSPVLAIGAAVGVDMYPADSRATPATFFITAPFLGPALGPIIGGFVAYHKDYKWTQWCAIFAAAGTLMLVLPCRETYKKIILQGISNEQTALNSQQAQMTGKEKLLLVAQVTLIRPVHMLFCEPIVTLLGLYSAFAFGVMFSFFDAFPFVFTSIYHFNLWQSGLSFLGLVVGVLLALATGAIIDRIHYQPQVRKRTEDHLSLVQPEHRLYCAMYGSFGITLGLFWFAWTARHEVHWISPILASVPFAWGNMCLFISGSLFMLDVYGSLNGASAMAANGFARYLTAGSFPLFTFQMFNNLGVQWAATLLACLSLLLVPIPWVLFKYGPSLRARSCYSDVKGGPKI